MCFLVDSETVAAVVNDFVRSECPSTHIEILAETRGVSVQILVNAIFGTSHHACVRISDGNLNNVAE